MSNEIAILTASAASIAFIHTALGPDHYLPFIVISKARKWKLSKTMFITFISGLGHVGSSVIIGSIGIVAGISLSKLKHFEGMRGSLVGWLFIAFGLVYFMYGVWRAIKMKPHRHFHQHEDGTYHEHHHDHAVGHNHIHQKEKPTKLTPWVLFLIFLFGPCEPLIPLLMFPAAEKSTGGIILVTLVFMTVTIATMMVIVYLLSKGIKIINLGKLERYMHAIAGFIILFSGVGINFLGL